MSVAEIVDQHIKPKDNWDTINIRSAPRTDPSTDVGDLAQAQRLELIGTIEDWFIARVYVSAQFTDLVSPIEPVKPDQTIDVPHGSPLTLAELQALSLDARAASIRTGRCTASGLHRRPHLEQIRRRARTAGEQDRHRSGRGGRRRRDRIRRQRLRRRMGA